MSGVIYSWNPRRPVLPGALGRRVPLRRRVNNFGDLIGPLVVQQMARRAGVEGPPRTDLFSVGSVLHFATEGATVWGSGINGKVQRGVSAVERLDVRAVRGPRTRELLLQHGFSCPEVYGDPALLLPDLLPELREWRASPRHDVTLVPNLHDWAEHRKHPDALNPRSPLRACLRRIAQSRLVVGSSLHGVVVAESLGIPARLVSPGTESLFKYDDYYRGTGRSTFTPAESPQDAVAMGGESPAVWEAQPLVDAFPVDLWAAEQR